MDPEGEKVFVSKSGDVSAYRSSTSKHASQGEDTLRGMTVDIESPQSQVSIIPLHVLTYLLRLTPYNIDIDFSIEKVNSVVLIIVGLVLTVMQEVQFKISE